MKMDKIEFMSILQACLWAYDNMSKEEMEKHLEKRFVKIGISLGNYIKSFDLNKEPANKIKEEQINTRKGTDKDKLDFY